MSKFEKNEQSVSIMIFTLRLIFRKIIGVIMVVRGCIEFFIKKSVFLSLVVYSIAISDCLSTRIPAKYPKRFNIESQKHGSLLKGKDRIDKRLQLEC